MSVLVDTLSSGENSGLHGSQNNTIKTDFNRHNWPTGNHMNTSVGWFLVLFSIVGIVGLVMFSKDFLQFAKIVSTQDQVTPVEPVKTSNLTPLKTFVAQESVRVRPIVPAKIIEPIEIVKNSEPIVVENSSANPGVDGFTDIISRMGQIEETLENIKDSLKKDSAPKVSQQPKSAAKKIDSSAAIAKRDKSKIKKSRRLKTSAIRQKIENANNLFLKGEIAKSEEIFNSVLKQNIFRREALMGLASIAVHNHQFEQARQTYKRILFLNPKDKEVESRLISLREMSDPMVRVSQLKNMIRVEPDNFNLHFILGTIYVGKEQWSEAKEAFTKAHILERDHPDTVYNLAVSLDHLKQTEEALKYYLLAAKLAKTHPVEFELKHVNNRIVDLQTYFAQYDEPTIVLAPDGVVDESN
ncbi:MAG: tetratricopeptide repeat protein [Magnetococcales bacterium]|nr:tetratricopeptide repeat protein [Magnetococcales bacterium]